MSASTRGEAVRKLPSQESVNGQARSDTKQKRWWRLVWCYERCFLPECEQRRQSLCEAARSNGASLICLKRASRLESWLEERTAASTAVVPKKSGSTASADEATTPPPYILMTDWREAMACAAAMMQQEQINRPAFTVLLCEQSQQLDLLLPWAQQAPHVLHPVYLCTDLGDVNVFLVRMVRRLVNDAQLPASFLNTLNLPRPLGDADSEAKAYDNFEGFDQQLQQLPIHNVKPWELSPTHLVPRRSALSQGQSHEEPSQSVDLSVSGTGPSSSSVPPSTLWAPRCRDEALAEPMIEQMYVTPSTSSYTFQEETELVMPQAIERNVNGALMVHFSPRHVLADGTDFMIQRVFADEPLVNRTGSEVLNHMATGRSSPVDELLDPVRHARTVLELDRLLRDAMPERYDD